MRKTRRRGPGAPRSPGLSGGEATGGVAPSHALPEGAEPSAAGLRARRITADFDADFDPDDAMDSDLFASTPPTG